MTPRDRVLRCLNHERVDRVLLSDSLRPEVWNKPKKHFGTEDTETIRETLGFDFKNAGMGLAEDFRERAISTDSGGVVILMATILMRLNGGRIAPRQSHRYICYTHCPLADQSNLDSYNFPPLDALGRWERLEEQVRQLQEEYVVPEGVSTFFRNAWGDLWGLEN